MSRCRATTIQRAHEQLGAAATCWAQQDPSSTLRRYGFRHGVAHLLASEQTDQAKRLLKDFTYGLARLKAEQGAGARPLSQDATAVLNTAQHTHRFELWEDFFRTRVHLLERGSGDWGAQKILLQLAVEHADDSPITPAAEGWLDQGNCDWLWLRHLRRRRSAAPGPCMRTLTPHEGEPYALSVFAGRLVYLSDSGCQLVVMDERLDRPSLSTKRQTTEQVAGVLADGRER